MRRWLLLASLAFLAGPAHADLLPPPPAEGRGTWSGTMHQMDSNQTYPMTLRLDGEVGTTDYPKLKCGGELERIGNASGGYVVYKETITRGGLEDGKETGCVDGVVIVHPQGNDIVLGWFGAFDGEPVLASARLTRSKGKSN